MTGPTQVVMFPEDGVCMRLVHVGLKISSVRDAGLTVLQVVKNHRRRPYVAIS